MKVFDLTHTICETMPVFPGTEKPKLFSAYTVEKDHFSETKMTLYSHTGTHIDPPAHIVKDGLFLDDFSIDQFIGTALVVDCTQFSENEQIPLSHLLNCGEKVEQVDFLLFNTGWFAKWGTDEYFRGYPCISPELLDYILERNYKGVGFDTMSLDPVDDQPIFRHKRMFSKKKMINIENLCNLDVFGDRIFTFSCFPVKVENSDGAPCRAVGWFSERDKGEADGF